MSSIIKLNNSHFEDLKKLLIQYSVIELETFLHKDQLKSFSDIHFMGFYDKYFKAFSYLAHTKFIDKEFGFNGVICKIMAQNELQTKELLLANIEYSSHHDIRFYYQNTSLQSDFLKDHGLTLFNTDKNLYLF
jgi:hypothetical protein